MEESLGMKHLDICENLVMIKCMNEVDLTTYSNDTSEEIYYNTSITNGKGGSGMHLE